MIKKSMQADIEWGLATLAFKVQALQFDLNRDLKYISMKDQIIRARTLIIGAYEAGLIGQRELSVADCSNVVIIGGGIGGISAALTVCQLGLKATVVEAAPACFPLLGLGSDRLFSATVYDWPHLHAGSHAFPYLSSLHNADTLSEFEKHSVLRFPSKPMTAGELRSHLLAQLDKYRLDYGPMLDIRTESRISGAADITVNAPHHKVVVDFCDKYSNKYHHECEIVVFALGFGLDKSLEQTQAGKDFFSYCDLQSDLEKARVGGGLVRIVGAGDGGLQEALRFLLTDDYHDLHLAVATLERMLDLHGGQWAELRSKLQTAEDHAAKSLMWGYSEDVVFSALHVIYEEVLGELLDKYGGTIESWADAVIRPLSIRVELLDKHAYSKRVYALNRFLIMLISKLSKKHGRAALERITSVSHGIKPDVMLTRSGFASTVPPSNIGTAEKEDLLRRIAFRAIPMNLDAVT